MRISCAVLSCQSSSAPFVEPFSAFTTSVESSAQKVVKGLFDGNAIERNFTVCLADPQRNKHKAALLFVFEASEYQIFLRVISRKKLGDLL